MNYSMFWVTICLAVSSCTSYAAPQESSSLSYTGIPDLYVELSEIHLVDVDKVKYSAYVDQDFGLSKVSISSNGAPVQVTGQCLQGVHFPDLQTLKVSKRVAKEGSEVEATIFKIDFHYFGDKSDALSENVELQDWSVKLLITNDLSGKLEVRGKGRKLSIECEVSATR
ncbi:hypothetical protein [Shewanella gelidii]|uniref:Lipoprotein n=1 Tax=Shewanella gelidii TaxID=1642821 RepID=A0A917JN62_9GAMM|nr:hypothetical protein [Shewanella gelidii]MCL1097826.1 hypothetical protein [Shewanella gelidii]GGI78438.1 hypothetical protein GCM10009332_14800 [Shewanella gelidii]